MTLHKIFKSITATLCLGAIVLAASSQAYAVDEPEPVEAIYNPDGTKVGYRTNDPNVYFLFPEMWTLFHRSDPPAAYLSTAEKDSIGAPLFDFQVVLGPDYTQAAPAVTAIRKSNPHALFFALPMTVEEVSLFLPQELGSIKAQLLPGKDLNSAFALYYRLRLTEEQASVLKRLANGSLALQGYVETIYKVPNSYQRSSVPITIVLPNGALDVVKDEIQGTQEQWLKDILEHTELHAAGVLDGPYTLGGGISVTLANSVVTAAFRPNSFQIYRSTDSVLFCAATISPNLDGAATFYISQLQAQIDVQYQARFEASLDLSIVKLGFTKFDIINATVNGIDSPFYKALLVKLMQTPNVQEQLANAFTRELQERILSQTLFGLEPILK